MNIETKLEPYSENGRCASSCSEETSGDRKRRAVLTLTIMALFVLKKKASQAAKKVGNPGDRARLAGMMEVEGSEWKEGRGTEAERIATVARTVTSKARKETEVMSRVRKRNHGTTL